ncbi:hypothetical protein [Flavivirga sp. 57AJ16]|uniref:hypothetical protein n=1 Tax=Flavivirga sp. 57AJ16 TaxID=3025307 RepID=UPI00236724AE|nr:hypothetical protein [Flavivirga sp. 57AJ16]MDD7887585.1 hypothetical protein [Flavivirga sp. 57AJ16]
MSTGFDLKRSKKTKILYFTPPRTAKKGSSDPDAERRGILYIKNILLYLTAALLIFISLKTEHENHIGDRKNLPKNIKQETVPGLSFIFNTNRSKILSKKLASIKKCLLTK